MATDPNADHAREASSAGNPAPGPGVAGQPERPYVPLGEALTRAVSPGPWWRRHRRSGHVTGAAAPTSFPAAGRRGAFPVVAALGAVLVLSLLGIAAPWDSNPAPARGQGALESGGPVLRGPSAEPVRPQTGEDCPPALSVVAATDIAPVVSTMAESLGSGSCPRVAVTAQRPAATLSTMADGGQAPDVWIPGSSLWLRQATTGTGTDLPTSGTSIARSPVVIALPERVHATLAGRLPAWPMIYQETVDGDIARMSMPGTDTTEGALALVSLVGALESWQDDGAFLYLLNFRNHLASTDADVGALLDTLAQTAPSAAGTQVGAFPATEQRLLTYNDAGPSAPVHLMGTYDAPAEADYPLAVSRDLDDRRAGIADDLLAELRSPAAAGLLVDHGFRPPRGASTQPAGLADTDRFPEYPDPVPVPGPDRWQDLLDGWTWSD